MMVITLIKKGLKKQTRILTGIERVLRERKEQKTELKTIRREAFREEAKIQVRAAGVRKAKARFGPKTVARPRTTTIAPRRARVVAKPRRTTVSPRRVAPRRLPRAVAQPSLESKINKTLAGIEGTSKKRSLAFLDKI